MATPEQVTRLRKMIDDPAGETQTWSDTDLSALIDQSEGNLQVAASELWGEKAATYARLVDVTESGSSRKMSDLYRNAIAMSKFYGEETTSATEPVVRARTRPIVRP